MKTKMIEKEVMCYYGNHGDHVERVAYDLDNVVGNWTEEDEIMDVLSSFMICPDRIEIL